LIDLLSLCNGSCSFNAAGACLMAVRKLTAPGNREPAVLGLASWIVRPSGESHVITFVAARRREGTSSVALEFARAAREFVGSRVLIVDATPRTILRDHPGRALLDTLRDQLPLELAIARSEDEVDRALLSEPGDPYPVLERTPDLGELWRPLRERYDTIAIDAPALEESPLGLVLARSSDAAIVVVQAERTRRPVVRRLVDLLRQTGAPVAGTVLNQRRHYIPRFIYDRL
jgi:Mrp family chromosome partitioning ATPase